MFLTNRQAESGTYSIKNIVAALRYVTTLFFAHSQFFSDDGTKRKTRPSFLLAISYFLSLSPLPIFLSARALKRRSSVWRSYDFFRCPTTEAGYRGNNKQRAFRLCISSWQNIPHIKFSMRNVNWLRWTLVRFSTFSMKWSYFMHDLLLRRICDVIMLETKKKTPVTEETKTVLPTFL